MPAKITTPLSILIFCYILIIVMCFIALALAGVMAYDLNHYFKNQPQVFAKKVCERYLEQEDYEVYEKCFYQAMEYFQSRKH